MYSACLHCHRRLGANEAVEHFQVGRRLAFDSAKGRLWVVCPHCARWNLTPIEERWEAVEDCERLFRGQRLRAQTDNVGLAKLREGTDLIRIGSPLRPEFAAWRYGPVFMKRLRNRIATIGGIGAAGVGVGLAATGLPITQAVMASGPFLLLPLMHLSIATILARQGAPAMKVAAGQGKPLRVSRENLEHTHWSVDENDVLRLNLRHLGGHADFEGDRAARVLATLLAGANSGGGTPRAVDNAVQLIAEAGDPRRALATITSEANRLGEGFEERAAEFVRAPRGRTIRAAMEAQLERQRRSNRAFSNWPPLNPGAIHRLPRVYRLALEMSLHESSEQRALEQQLAALERDWREAEEIAAIADHLV
jgi:hypothetical protein